MNRRIESIMYALTETPDSGLTPAETFIEDLVIDYCLDGNGLMVPMWNTNRELKGLKRYRPHDAYIITSPRTGDKMYRLTEADTNIDDRSEYHSQMNVIHARWGRVQRDNIGSTSRNGFAVSPVNMLRVALEIGINSNRHIRQWYIDGVKSQVHFNVSPPEDVENPVPLPNLRI